LLPRFKLRDKNPCIILGLVSIAYERGMTIEVESDYIPKYIFQGDFLK